MEPFRRQGIARIDARSRSNPAPPSARDTVPLPNPNRMRSFDNPIKDVAAFNASTETLARLHEAIANVEAEDRTTAEDLALVVHVLARARLAFLHDNPKEWLRIRRELLGSNVMDPGEALCDVCGLVVEAPSAPLTASALGGECYNSVHNFYCDPFFTYADPSNPEKCDEGDACAHCSNND